MDLLGRQSMQTYYNLNIPNNKRKRESMSANKPFLERFAKRSPEDQSNSDTAKGTSKNDTISTRVARETTDDR